MVPGTQVRLKADPGRIGFITGKTRDVAGKIRWQIKFPDGVDYHRKAHLEIVSEIEEDPIDLLRRGEIGRAQDLRGNLTHIRLSGRLANLIYSMGTTNTDFYPYQFKPVLSFLEAPGNGLLIADEVGLGKTIEAGLIWTELRSRYDIRRVLVLVPAMLQAKWRYELLSKFGIETNTLKAGQVLDYFKDHRAGERIDFSIISSMQGLRPRRGWNRDDSLNDSASNLARFVKENQYEEPLIDLLIIDEAHYLRNPDSMTSKLGRLLRDVSDHIILLSATPIHLKNRDLYQLLNLVDENTFDQPSVFDEILEANEPILKARDTVLNEGMSRTDFVEMMKAAKLHPFFTESRQIGDLIEKPPTDEEMKDNVYRTTLANRLESINLLGRTVVRTRKRDVTSLRVIRNPFPERIPMSDIERKFYLNVTELVRDYALKHKGYEAFLLVMPQRQMSSSMPAALEEWLRKGEFDSEQAYEDVGFAESLPNMGPLTRELVLNAQDMGDPEELRKNDSKYIRLREILTDYLNRHPKDKIVLFAYFRPTLNYLKKRLTKDGISCITLMGGGNFDKQEILNEFASKKGPNVLLSSEVASEGIDLQFSKVLINYDLPWNPMKVEQRIGRLDRIGQSSAKIFIWNLFYDDTIDARIYDRLYVRLKIFERALGGLEAVLGEKVRNLTTELLTEKLTPAQEDARIEQTAQAIAVIRDTEERLESEASNLIAHGDYILQQVNAAQELERIISNQDIWNYIYEFFIKKYPGSEFLQIEPDELVFNVKLSVEAKADFRKFLENNQLQGLSRLPYTHHSSVKCHFINRTGFNRKSRKEIINQFHPLVRFVSDGIKASSLGYYSPVSVQISRQEVVDISPGVYAFSVERWSISGVREMERLSFAVRKLTKNSSFLNDDKAEKLVTIASREGQDWLSAKNEVDLDLAASLIEECLYRSELQYEQYIIGLKNENHDRADVQEKSLKAHQNKQLEKLKAIRDNQFLQQKESIARMTQGRIDALKARLEQKLFEISQRRDLRHHKQEVCIGLIFISELKN